MSEMFGRLALRTAPTLYRCEREWRWESPTMPDHDLWCVLSGRGEMVCRGERHELRAGSCWLLEPGDTCCAAHDPARRLRVFAVHFDLLDGEGRDRQILPSERPSPGRCVAELSLLEAMCRGCVASYGGGGQIGAQQAQLFVRQILLMMLKPPTPQANVRDSRVAAVHQEMLEDPGRDWRVPDMALMAGLSRSQFTRRFREMTGRSPARCLLEARVDRAAALLRETSMSVGEVAEMLGYCDIFYFSRQFKQVMGLSPTAFRVYGNTCDVAARSVS